MRFLAATAQGSRSVRNNYFEPTVLSVTLPQRVTGAVQSNIMLTQIPHSPPSHMSAVQTLLLGFALLANIYSKLTSTTQHGEN